MEQYNVTGMSCAACSARVEKAVSKVPGVTSCSVSLLTNSMGVEGDASPSDIIAAVEAAGYGASEKSVRAEEGKRQASLAAAKNKLSFRTLAGVNLYNQTDEAEAIDSALVKRAAVEALNVADRQVDLAWLAEGDKVNGQMERFRRNIDRILLCGGTPDERERWEEYYQVYQCAINATKDAYMPNAQRKKEYLRISEDVARQNGTLVLYLARKQNATVTEGLLNAEEAQPIDKGSILRDAVERWNESRFAVRGSQTGGGSGGSDGEETVNRN